MFISVIMPAYNAERYVAESIDSILRQTHQHFELTIVDDGSTDSTPEILREFLSVDPRVHIVTQENAGVANALNRAISMANSQWIAVMHADDVMEVDRLERQVAFVTENPGLAVASSFVTNIDANGRTIGRFESELTTDEAFQAARARDVVVGFHHPAVIMRKHVIESLGGYRQQFWPAEDLDLWNRVADAGYRILVQPEYLVRYRIHEKAASVREARLVSERISWIECSALNRRRGLPEPSLEEFREAHRSLPVYSRLNKDRKNLARVLYKQGSFSFSINRPVRSAFLILQSSLLDPGYAPPQVWRKLLRPRLARFKPKSSSALD